MTIRVVAFDLDDTLWPLRPVLLRSESILTDYLKRQHNITYSREKLAPLRDQVLQREPRLAGMVGQFRLELLRLLMMESGQDAEVAGRNSRRAFEVFLEARNQVTFYDGALDTLAELKPLYRLGSLSNGNADIRATGLSSFFSFGFSAEDVGAPKPDPALFHAAIEATGAEPHEMVYVGDDPDKDIKAAADAGLCTVWANHGQVSFSGSQPADGTIENLRELPRLLRSFSPESRPNLPSGAGRYSADMGTWRDSTL